MKEKKGYMEEKLRRREEIKVDIEERREERKDKKGKD